MSAPPSSWRDWAQCHGRPIAGDTLAFEEIAGLVRMATSLKQASIHYRRALGAPQPLAVGDSHSIECRPSLLDPAATSRPASSATASPVAARRFVMVDPLKSREALAAAQPRAECSPGICTRDRFHARIHLLRAHRALHGVPTSQARMFAPRQSRIARGSGYRQRQCGADRATRRARARCRDLRLEKKIAQGVRYGHGRVCSKRAPRSGRGKVTATFIGGACVAGDAGRPRSLR